MPNKDLVAIIGAGLTGLTLARMLTDVGIESVLIEKGKSVGGRMATRRDSDCTYDHGAQYFSESLGEKFFWQDRWQEQKVSRPWFSRESKSYLCGAKGMTSLAKNLATDLNILFGEKVVSIKGSSNDFEVLCESGKLITAGSVVLTSPLPQSLDIFRASKIIFPESLENILYAKALVGLFHFEGENLDSDYVNPASHIFSVANNYGKGISAQPALTVVMNAEFSDSHFEHSDESSLQLIQLELKKNWTKAIVIKSQQLKKWRYSHPTSVFTEKYFSVLDKKIILAGDAFGGASLNGAVRSARAVFEKFYQKNASIR